MKCVLGPGSTLIRSVKVWFGFGFTSSPASAGWRRLGRVLNKFACEMDIASKNTLTKVSGIKSFPELKPSGLVCAIQWYRHTG